MRVDWHQTPSCFYVSQKLIIKKWWGLKADKEEEGEDDEESVYVHLERWGVESQVTL